MSSSLHTSLSTTVNVWDQTKLFLQTDDYRQTSPFLTHLLDKISTHIAQQGKILIIALTKKSSEEIANFLLAKGLKTYYLHSEINTVERREIIKKLRTGVIDIIVWVNLLREGIDLPEVTLIAILDADKEWFLRSTTSLVQIIGRAARNPLSEVVLYADRCTPSMYRALHETYRRRDIQQSYNTKHGLTPQIAISNIKNLDVVKTDDWLQDFNLAHRGKNKRLKRLTKVEKQMMLKDLKWQLDHAISIRDFESAAQIRDQIKELSGE